MFHSQTPYQVVVPEDAPVGKMILDSIKAEDPDLLGESIEVTCREVTEVSEIKINHLALNLSRLFICKERKFKKI